MTVKSYRDLEVWQRGIELVSSIYRATRSLPEYERFGLISQMQRAAVSVPANIAEGAARDHTKEFLRHLSIARGSLAELETLSTIARELGYLDQQQSQRACDLAAEVGRMLNGLQQSLRRNIANH